MRDSSETPAREQLRRIEVDAAQTTVIVEAAWAETGADPSPADLLKVCQAHLDADRLTVGKGGNAADCYADVLALEPGNTEALAGLDAILGRYKELIEGALKKGNLPTARVFLSRMQGLNADSTLVVGLQQRIARLEARPRPEPAGVSVAEPESPSHVQIVQPSSVTTVQDRTDSLNRGLVAYYPFNGNANDASGHDRHGIVSGASLTADRFGTPNSAYKFDGNDKIMVDALREFAWGDQLTVSIWFKRTGGVAELPRHS